MKISVINKDICTKIAVNIYGYEIWPNFEKQMAAIADCLKIIKML